VTPSLPPQLQPSLKPPRRTATIVLCGGPLNPTNVPVGASGSNAMVPVNGKPVIAWIIDDLLRKGVGDIVVVLRQQHKRLKLFLERAYNGRLSIRFAVAEPDGSIVDSLSAGLQSVDGSSVRLVLGDTLITDQFDGVDDVVCAAEVEDSRRWCVLRVNDRDFIEEYLDKKELPGSQHLAAAGNYVLGDAQLLKDSVKDALAAGSRELSAVLTRYGQERPLKVRRIHEWHDFGHIDNFTRAKSSLLQARFFNSLHVDPVLNTITKVSTDTQKLEDELAWYQSIPDSLKVLTPRIVSERRVNGSAEIVQEYYGYPTLAELFVYSDLGPESWRPILRRVLAVHKEFTRHAGDVTTADAIEMYLTKTYRRLEQLRASDAGWASRLTSPSICFNGKNLRNASVLLDELSRSPGSLIDAVAPGIVHGDLCFSNILFDFNNQIIRLIDPRGRFGRPGIFGDSRYDISKLRHSVHGLYDFIMADMFQITGDGGGANGSVFIDGTQTAVANIFDDLIRDAGYDVQDIQRIEGLLFLSMLPLHGDHPRRQEMLYYTGLRLLDEVM
jgi:dTDP-glucose pyrophosphorylase